MEEKTTALNIDDINAIISPLREKFSTILDFRQTSTIIPINFDIHCETDRVCTLSIEQNGIRISSQYGNNRKFELCDPNDFDIEKVESHLAFVALQSTIKSVSDRLRKIEQTMGQMKQVMQNSPISSYI